MSNRNSLSFVQQPWYQVAQSGCNCSCDYADLTVYSVFTRHGNRIDRQPQHWP